VDRLEAQLHSAYRQTAARLDASVALENKRISGMDLFAQIQRILEINHLHAITAEVIHAASETLVIGQP
jgi:hypothetical protein